MQQVAELADQARGGRVVVVGAEQRRELGVVLERGLIRLNTSPWTATSASTKTSTSPVAARAPSLRACAAPSRSASSTRKTSSGASSAAAIAARQRATVAGVSVAGTNAERRVTVRGAPARRRAEIVVTSRIRAIVT